MAGPLLVSSSRIWAEEVINWYPGHMAKATETIKKRVKQCTHILDLRDARIPLSSANEALDEIIASSRKRRIIVFNKTDLAQQKVINMWKRYFEQPDPQEKVDEKTLWLSVVSERHKGGGAWTPKQREEFHQLIRVLRTPILHQQEMNIIKQYGDNSREIGTSLQADTSDLCVEDPAISNPASIHNIEADQSSIPIIREEIERSNNTKVVPNVIMIVGLPNVGKSTMINQLVGKRGASVAAKPAWTRGVQLFRIDDVALRMDKKPSTKDTASHSENTRSLSEAELPSNSSSKSKSSRITNSSLPSRKSGYKQLMTPRGIDLPKDESFSKSSSRSQRLSSVDNSNGLWLMDTPGVMVPHRIDTERGLKLALCGNIADHVVPRSFQLMAEYLHFLLMELPTAPKSEVWVEGLGLQPNHLGEVHNLDSVLAEVGKRIGKKDRMAQSQYFITAYRSGKFGPFSLESPLL